MCVLLLMWHGSYCWCDMGPTVDVTWVLLLMWHGSYCWCGMGPTVDVTWVLLLMWHGSYCWCDMGPTVDVTWVLLLMWHGSYCWCDMGPTVHVIVSVCPAVHEIVSYCWCDACPVDVAYCPTIVVTFVLLYDVMHCTVGVTCVLLLMWHVSYCPTYVVLLMWHISYCWCDIWSSAGSIFDISKYRDTCESSIPIPSGIAILRYFGIKRPLVDTFDIEYIRRRRCEGATSLSMTSLFTGTTTSLHNLTYTWLFKK